MEKRNLNRWAASGATVVMIAGSSALAQSGARVAREINQAQVVLDAAPATAAADGIAPATVSFSMTLLGAEGASSTMLDRSLRVHGFAEPSGPTADDATWNQSAASVSTLFTGDSLLNNGFGQTQIEPGDNPGYPPVIIPLPTPGILAAAGLGALALLRRSRRQPA